MHLATLIVAVAGVAVTTYFGKRIMSNQERLDELATNLTRISTEIKAAIEDLKNQPPESLDFGRVDAAVGELDDAAPPVETPGV